VYWNVENDRVARESKAMTWETVESSAAGMRDRARAALVKAIDDVSVKWFSKRPSSTTTSTRSRSLGSPISLPNGCSAAGHKDEWGS
jgi:hypothetical protein